MGFHAIRTFFGGRDAGVKFVNFKPVGFWPIRVATAPYFIYTLQFAQTALLHLLRCQAFV